MVAGVKGVTVAKHGKIVTAEPDIFV